MALEALKEIRKAEKKAEELVKGERTAGEKALLTAEKARNKEIEETQIQARKTVEKKISQASRDAQKKVAELQEKGKKEMIDMRDQAEKRMKKAVEIVLEKLYLEKRG
ncbi:hypothetical protein KAX22_07000 [bacterium]|nr:hypothetical protein [bacterium]